MDQLSWLLAGATWVAAGWLSAALDWISVRLSQWAWRVWRSLAVQLMRRLEDISSPDKWRKEKQNKQEKNTHHLTEMRTGALNTGRRPG